MKEDTIALQEKKLRLCLKALMEHPLKTGISDGIH
jgi:hypothetical protein